MTKIKIVNNCFICGSPVKNTEIYTYYCEKCHKAFVVNSKDIHVVSAKA